MTANPLLQGIERFADRLGNTPVVELEFVLGGVPRTVLVKLEAANPTGSVKARSAVGLLASLVEQGAVTRRSTLVESTSGNLGIALAALCRDLELAFKAVVDPNITPENRRRLESYGADLVLVDQRDEAGGYLLSRLARVRKILAGDPAAVWTDQYSNAANPAAHYRATAPEILRQVQPAPDAVFVAVSTGGTFAGISRYFRATSPSTRMIAVDIEGSVVLGGPPARRYLPGIGASRRSSFLAPALIDASTVVPTAEAVAYCRLAADRLGLRLGASSGAVLAACCRYLRRHPEVRRPLCLSADNGDNYATTLYRDSWLRRAGIDLTAVDTGPVEVRMVPDRAGPRPSRFLSPPGGNLPTAPRKVDAHG
jgi:N-(2-amino-2-carboxyethyl)-L-glutamate synthase